MKIRATIWFFVIAAALVALVLLHGKRKLAEMPVAVSPVIRVAPPTVAATSSPVSTLVNSNAAPAAQVASSMPVPTPPMDNKEQLMREHLANFNDVDIAFMADLKTNLEPLSAMPKSNLKCRSTTGILSVSIVERQRRTGTDSLPLAATGERVFM